MTRQHFDMLVQRIESRYAGRQRALERVTAAWVFFGLAGMLCWLVLLFLLGAAAFVGGVVLEPAIGIFLLGLAVFLIVYGISQAALFLLVERPPREGRKLRAGEAPELIAMLDSLRQELQCRPFSQVRISMAFNASVQEIPRLGVFGWPKTILEIGLPLLATLSPSEVRAVLAHEFVHLSARHGRGGNRIYRLHRTWGAVFERMQRPLSGSFDRLARSAVSKFIGWYWPRFHARALVLSRMQEFQADRVASGLAGNAVMALSLWRMECLCPWFAERFWPDLFQLSKELPEPPADVLDRMRSALLVPPATEDAARWVERGLNRVTAKEESHPSLYDRVTALGLSAESIRAIGFPPPVEQSAAEVLLGDSLRPIEDELVARWRRENHAGWRERHRRAQPEATKSEPAAVATSPQPVDTVALWEAARDTITYQGIAAAEPLLRAILERDPSHAGAAVVLGGRLLTLGDAEGERLLWQVVDQVDEQWMPQAGEALQEHYRSIGQVDRLKDVRARLDQFETDREAAARERAAVLPGDRFLPHDLDEAQIQSLRAALHAESDCKAAWLVRKGVRYFPKRPLFVLCVRGPTSRWGFGNADADRQLVRRLIPRVELPGQVLVISPTVSFAKLARKVMGKAGSQVWPAEPAAVPALPAEPVATLPAAPT